MQICVTSDSDRIADDDLAFLVAACDQQAEEFCRDWGLAYVPVVFYARGTDLGPKVTHALVIVDDIGQPGIRGFHDVDDNGVAFARVEAPDTAAELGRILSHECLELIGNPKLDKWAPWRGKLQQAVESCDRCQDDTYLESVEIIGETRGVAVSNYLLPAAFEPNSVGPWDRMGRLRTWDDVSLPGGYTITRDELGRVVPVFGSRATASADVLRKFVNPQSRTTKLMRGA